MEPGILQFGNLESCPVLSFLLEITIQNTKELYALVSHKVSLQPGNQGQVIGLFLGTIKGRIIHEPFLRPASLLETNMPETAAAIL